MKKRITGLMLCLSILISCFAFGAIQTAAADTSSKTTDTDYGLPKKIEDGNILQCFNWKYNDIKSELKGIAEAGFTAVQTSPAQPGDTGGKWFWLYQPCGFYINYNDLGNRSELQSLCTEAKKYGIKIIVDVVANHLTGDHGKIQNDLKDGKYWHNYGKVTNWKDRYQVTHGDIGMQDLKTEDSYVQSVVKKYLNDLKSIGVSGFRFDAAKHIGTPAEGDDFFKMVKSVGLWSYGEILDNPGGKDAEVMKEYTKYISVSDCNYSGELTGHMRDGEVVTNSGHWKTKGVDGSKLIYWGESHDTFANNPNDGGWTKNLKQEIIDRSYAILGSRSDAQALYLSRPGSTDRESIYAGNKGSTHYKSKEVAAVNHFKNALVGRGESYTSGDGCDVVCREGGAVVVSAKGSSGKVTVPNADSLVIPGTYTDEVTGNKWTVTDTIMTGTLGNTGIAVFYSTEPYVRPTEAPTEAPTTAPTEATTQAPTTAPTEAPTTVATEAPTEIKDLGTIGDANEDKNVNIKDATLIQKSIADLAQLSETAKLLADVNSNGRIDIKDATCIQKYLAMMSGSENAGKSYKDVITSK